LNLSANKDAVDLIQRELKKLLRQNEPLTKNNKNLTAERDLCCHSECSLGSLIADAMVTAMEGDDTWSRNSSRIGMFPAKYLKANSIIPEGTFAKADGFDSTYLL
jgi:2',3'-cyclic-nucleotide 2'-phosphodiesterase (5'-nucleotidase family)